MASKQKLLAGGLLATLLLSAQIAAHAEIDQLVRDANGLVQQGQSKQAFDLLEPQEVRRAGDPDFDTVLGIAANETGQYTRAIFALERVLSVQPENSRARAELGRALYAVGDNQASRRVLMETRQGNIPVEAAATIDQFLQAIDRNEEATRSSVRGYVEAGLGHDTNVNGGPASGNVAVPAFGGLIFTLAPGAKKQEDTYATLGAGISGRYVVDPRWSLLGNASINGRGNFSADDFNTLQVDASAGASYRVEKHEFSGAVQAGTYDVDGSTSREQWGVVGEWTYRPDGNRQWSTYLQWGELKYPGQSIRNVDRTVLGTSYAQSFRNGFLAYGGAYVGTERQNNSAFPQFGHDLIGVRGGLQQELSPTLALYASANYEDRRYDGADPLFLRTRHDKQTSLNLGLNWVPGKYWRVTPQISYTNIKSNIPINDYDRTIVSVVLRRDF
ncbi:MAG: surface lipoprotein assembly modifier [Polaromonas sp.]|nr:surface lipoprotein assembly modifier [Polaromonas sp.]